MKVFLGGTCNGSSWRDRLIPSLKVHGIEYFSPLDLDWTKESLKEEKEAKESCDILLFVVTPLEQGFFSVAQLIESAIKYPKKTIFHYIKVDKLDEENYRKFDLKHSISLEAVGEMVEDFGGVYHMDWNCLVKDLACLKYEFKDSSEDNELKEF